MSHGLLGRTNKTFPHVWFSLSAPRNVDAPALATAASRANTVLDITSSPALWGAHAGSTDMLLIRGGEELETATGRAHAADLIQAKIIQTVCAIGRPSLDFFCLEINRSVQDQAIQGALEALEEARQDGMIRYVGLASSGSVVKTLNAWQPHDAFDILIASKESLEALQGLAHERRVGLVIRAEEPDPKLTTLIQVSTPADVERWAGAAI